MKVYESFPQKLCSEEHYYQFTGYAYQRILWAVLDKLRKDGKRYSNENGLSENYLSILPSESNINEEDVLLSELFQSMLHSLNKREQEYLISAVIYRLNITDIARKYGVSRKTVYQWKRRISEKLKEFRTGLTK